MVDSATNKSIIKRQYWLIGLLSLAAVFFLGLAIGAKFLPRSGGQAVIKGVDPTATSTYGDIINADGEIPEYLTKDVDFRLFWDVWNLIKNKYYDKNIPETKLFYGALSGLVAALEDSHSVFLTPQNTDFFKEELEGNFEGVGAEIGIRNNILTVIAPLPDTPAFKAGLKPKDMILEIDGQTTEGMGVDEAVSLIRGPQGTAVTLLVYREGQSSSKEISITREAINIKSVEWEIRSDNIAYLKIRQFNEMTMPLFNDAVLDILSRPDIRGIILDLRYNPGGYLQTAIDVSGEWINGKLVVSEKLRDGSEILHNSTKKARLDAYQTVVLVNAGSASASEIVAGALQDWGEGVIVGEKTFGKGSIQDLNNLSDGSSVKLTVAKWFTPQGRSIDDEGIEPDVAVEMIEANYDQFRDPQLDKAVEIIFSNN